MFPPLKHAFFLLLLSAAFILLSQRSRVWAQSDSYGGAPIHYATAEVNDRVMLLARKLDAGETTLDFDSKMGYLKSVLKELEIPVSSQTLVFSKTSLQLHRISPRRPRALYFNDDVYVGYCQRGDVLEIAATDAKQGATFYTVKQSEDGPVEFKRDQGVCLSCHSSHRTQDVPGYLMRSVFSDSLGRPLLNKGTFTTDDSSPFEERWGGWYVTGSHGTMQHMGNVWAKGEGEAFDFSEGANQEAINDRVLSDAYPSQHSDIVALMVLQHQTQMHNAMAWANYETRRAVYQSDQMNELLGREVGTLSESAERRISRAAENVVKYLLFSGEFALESSVKGTSRFAEEFESLGKRDRQGRSLRDFDLETRLFRYPCSFLIHSDAFDGMPDLVRVRVLQRLKEVLEGDAGEDFQHLTQDLRIDIGEILSETKPEFDDV